MEMCIHVKKHGDWWWCCCLIDSHIRNSCVHLYLPGLTRAPRAPLYGYIDCGRLIYSGQRWASTEKGHYRPSAPVWDTRLIRQCIIKRALLASGENEKIYWPKLVDGLQELCMGFMVSWWAKTHKKTPNQYKPVSKALGSNIICWKQIEATALRRIFKMFFFFVFVSFLKQKLLWTSCVV